MNEFDCLFEPLTLPCGVVLKNRIAKAAMSDSLGDGQGNPTSEQVRLYERWAEGDIGLSIIGEVQGNPCFAEKPGNLVLNTDSDAAAFASLANRGSANATQLWLQLGHAGAMAFPPTSTPKGPSALDIPGLSCGALTQEEIQSLPGEFANTARLAKESGFGGVEVHAAHGFLLSQFLSPLFNKRQDSYGGSIEARMRLLLEVVDSVRAAVGPALPIAVKLNSSDQLEGGFDQEGALAVVSELNNKAVDLIDISGGTYFPGAASASDGTGKGPYFTGFAKRARECTDIPLMVTGGFKTRAQAISAVEEGIADVVGLARCLALAPDLARLWRHSAVVDQQFPRFESPPEGGVTAWYTMRLTDIANDDDSGSAPASDLEHTLLNYESRDKIRAEKWNERFHTGTG